MRIVASLLIAILLATPKSTWAQATPISTDRHNFWTITSFRSSPSGPFLLCEATQQYTNGNTLTFAIYNDQRRGIRVHNNSWSITPGREIFLRYQVDQGPTYSWSGIPMNRNTIGFFIPSDNNLLNSLRLGNILFVEMGGFNTSFRLTDSATVINRLLTCVQDGGSLLRPQPQQQATTRPPAAQPREEPNTRSAQRNPMLQVTAEQRLAAALFASRMLAQPNMEGMRLLSPSEAREVGLTPFENGGDHLFWRNSNRSVAGILTVVRVLSSIENIASELLASQSRECQGDFMSGRTSDPEFPQTRRIHSYCARSQAASSFIANIIIPLPGNIAYDIMIFGEGSVQDMNREEQRAWRAIRSIMQ